MRAIAEGDPLSDAPDTTTPRGQLAIRTVAMPADTNPSGDIFGGWLLAQMDIAGGTTATNYSGGRVATVGIESMSFHQPVRVGDVLCAYAELQKTGRTSMTYLIEAWVVHPDGNHVKVTQGVFTYVALTPDGVKRTVPPH